MQYDTSSIKYIVIGSLVGFGYFIFNALTMNGILIRKNSENKNKLTFYPLLEYLKTPFKFGSQQFKVIWGLLPNLNTMTRIKMTQLNWVVTSSLGGLIGYSYWKYTK